MQLVFRSYPIGVTLFVLCSFLYPGRIASPHNIETKSLVLFSDITGCDGFAFQGRGSGW